MAILRQIRTFQFDLTRKLIHIWIRPKVLNADVDSLGVSERDILCYVLPSRSIADLLVIDKASEVAGLPKPTSAIAPLEEARAFFCLGHSEGALGRKSLRPRSSRMTRLFDHQERLPAESIKVVPVSLFWGHQPDREKSVLKLLLSENWTVTRGIKKFLAGLFHRQHILLQYSAPIDMRELMASESNRELQVKKLLRLLRVRFNKERQAILGPDLSHRRTLINTILESPTVRAVIEREAVIEGSPAAAERKALKYAKEIVADQSYRVVRFFDVLLTWLWHRLYDGIEVRRVAAVKELAQSHEIVYVPCHRSHIDYLLLSYVLYHNGLTPPHIASGENLNLPIVGGLLRRAGAFFMRRSFRGDPLYKEVFDEYLHQMFTRGYSIEYFIEGGRSRTGRTLSPRTGMLSMTVRSFQRDSDRPIVFVPVYFGYERVLESTTYMAELSGARKKRESIIGLLKVFPTLRQAFGEVTVNFGEPLPLAAFLAARADDWQNMPAGDFSATCHALARELAGRINAAAAIKPTSLVALALLATERQSMDEEHLLHQVKVLMTIAHRCGGDMLAITEMDANEVVAEAIRILGLEVREHKFGNIVSASPEQAVAMTYNANNVLHVFALASLVARYVRTLGRTTAADLAAHIAAVHPYVKAEMFLRCDTCDLPAEIDSTLKCMAELGLVLEADGEVSPPPPTSGSYNSLQELASITDPVLERFHIVMAVLQRTRSASVRQLEIAASGIAEQLAALHGINSPDFFERSLFATFLNTLKQEGVVIAVENWLAPEAGISELDEAIAATIDSRVRYGIHQSVERGSAELVAGEGT